MAADLRSGDVVFRHACKLGWGQEVALTHSRLIVRPARDVTEKPM